MNKNTKVLSFLTSKHSFSPSKWITLRKNKDVVLDGNNYETVIIMSICKRD